MNKYYIELSESGIKIFKGGNIEIMVKALINFKAKNMKEAKDIFYKHLNLTIGTSNTDHYNINEVQK